MVMLTPGEMAELRRLAAEQDLGLATAAYGILGPALQRRAAKRRKT